MEIISNAKINLSLNVLGISGGYHLLDMIVVSVSHSDTIVIYRRNDDKINVEVEGVISDFSISKTLESARVIVRKIQADFNTAGVDILIRKGIWETGGLGGSSAVAAGVIRGMVKVFDLHGKSLIKEETALQWGSDVPCQITGGFLRVQGRGEELEILDGIPKIFLVLASSGGGVNTAESFREFDKKGELFDNKKADNDRLVSALKKGNLESLKDYALNMLYPSSKLLNPLIEKTIEQMKATDPLYTSMTGSGSTCFGIYRNKSEAKRAAESLKNKLPFVTTVETMPPNN